MRFVTQLTGYINHQNAHIRKLISHHKKNFELYFVHF